MKIKQTLLAILLAALSGIAYGQTASDTNQVSRYLYCELLGYGKLFSNKVTVSVDYGEAKGFFKDPRMRDEQTGKIQTFNSMVDALNYMGEDGWEFVQAYVVTTAQQNVYHWLLKKPKG